MTMPEPGDEAWGYEIVAYALDDEQPVPDRHVLLGLGAYADEGEPDVCVRILAPDAATAQLVRRIIEPALETLLCRDDQEPEGTDEDILGMDPFYVNGLRG